MDETGRERLVKSLKEFAEQLTQDIATIQALREEGTITQDEADETSARMAGELDKANDAIAEFSKFLR